MIIGPKRSTKRSKAVGSPACTERTSAKSAGPRPGRSGAACDGPVDMAGMIARPAAGPSGGLPGAVASPPRTD